jgi:hypothetical protein
LVGTSHAPDTSPNGAPVICFIVVSGVLEPLLALSGLKFCLVSVRTVQSASDFRDFDGIHGLPSVGQNVKAMVKRIGKVHVVETIFPRAAALAFATFLSTES